MCDKAIGVFDSGVGGLTAVRELTRLLPGEDIIYFGDTGRVPYGSKSRETIEKYAMQDIRFLTSKGVKYIIIACGTASATLMDKKHSFALPVTGVIEPAAAAAALATKNNKVGVIATETTVSSGAYFRSLKAQSEEIEVLQTACPLFVPLVEEGWVSQGDPVVEKTAERYLSGLKKAGIDTLILGCTHYPLLTDIIRDYMGEGVKLINSGQQAALSAAAKLCELGLLNEKKSGGREDFYLSDSTEKFENIAEYYLGYRINGAVNRIDIEQY